MRRNRLVLPLATLGGAASVSDMLINYGVAGDLISWWGLSFCIVGGAVIGMIYLYLFAAVTRWLGRKMGGQASLAAVRAAFAWGSLPSILGLFVLMLLVAGLRVFAGGPSAAVSAWLPIVGSVCGLWSITMTLLMLSKVEGFGFWRTTSAYVAGALLLPAFLALVTRTFLFQPFNIPAASMSPTLLVGDYFFVTKYAYGYSRYSLPFSPRGFEGRILASEPRPGDVVVFRLPKKPVDFVKRIVGLPGDRIQMKQGLLYINDAAVAREPLADFVGEDPCGSRIEAGAKRWRETLPNGASYETLDCVDGAFFDNTTVYSVPDGYVFVLGDNRDNSTDSRVQSAVGYVPLQNIIGRVGMIFLSKMGEHGGARAIRYERIGTMIR